MNMNKIILQITKDWTEEIVDEGFVFSIDLNEKLFSNPIRKVNRKIKIKYSSLCAKKCFLLNKNKYN